MRNVHFVAQQIRNRLFGVIQCSIRVSKLQNHKLTIQKLKQEEADRLSAKADAEAKLAALGLTADDLKALGLA